MPIIGELVDRFGKPPVEVCVDWSLQLAEQSTGRQQGSLSDPTTQNCLRRIQISESGLIAAPKSSDAVVAAAVLARWALEDWEFSAPARLKPLGYDLSHLKEQLQRITKDSRLRNLAETTVSSNDPAEQINNSHREAVHTISMQPPVKDQITHAANERSKTVKVLLPAGLCIAAVVALFVFRKPILRNAGVREAQPEGQHTAGAGLAPSASSAAASKAEQTLDALAKDEPGPEELEVLMTPLQDSPEGEIAAPSEISMAETDRISIDALAAEMSGSFSAIDDANSAQLEDSQLQVTQQPTSASATMASDTTNQIEELTGPIDVLAELKALSAAAESTTDNKVADQPIDENADIAAIRPPLRIEAFPPIQIRRIRHPKSKASRDLIWSLKLNSSEELQVTPGESVDLRRNQPATWVIAAKDETAQANTQIVVLAELLSSKWTVRWNVWGQCREYPNVRLPLQKDLLLEAENAMGMAKTRLEARINALDQFLNQEYLPSQTKSILRKQSTTSRKQLEIAAKLHKFVFDLQKILGWSDGAFEVVGIVTEKNDPEKTQVLRFSGG